jgi:tRNA modification GTPase
VSETIYALSSGAPPAAIAIVRISGSRADVALEALAGQLPEARRATLVSVRSGGELLDRAIAIRFPGPDSATGEDLAELHLHGGRAVVASVLGALGGIDGLRQAEPGEFTRRAFENGRIDLAEAEGLADLLASETETQRRSAMAMAGGALSREVEAWRGTLLALAADVEAMLDFSDEGDVASGAETQFAARILALRNDLRAAFLRPPAERLRDGIRTAIAGPPNAGKSSLLNALVQREAAITSESAGTTRDLIEAPVSIAGIAFLLIDTAGLRAAHDPVESIGIERAESAIAAADIVLWLGDAGDAPAGAIRVGAKADLGQVDDDADVAVSAVSGQGIGELVQMIIKRARTLIPRSGEAALNARHRMMIGECLEALGEAADTEDMLIVAESLRHARAALDRITGRAGVEDMLDALFGRFCVGK